MPLYPARDGEQLHVRVIGRGQPVVLLHGVGSSGFQWLPFVWMHRRQYQFYIPDLRTMGRSAAVSFNQQDIIQNFVEDLEDMLSHFGLDAILLGGHSLGNTISLHWQKAGGFSNVRRYLHIDQSPCIVNQPDWPYGIFGADQERFFAQSIELRELLARHAADEFLYRLPATARKRAMQILGDTFARITGINILRKVMTLLAGSPALLRRSFPTQRLSDLEAVVASSLDAQDYRDSLRGCITPMTVMIGSQSQIYDPRGQKAMAELAENARIIEFVGAGHLLMMQQPLKFAREFKAFLRVGQAGKAG